MRRMIAVFSGLVFITSTWAYADVEPGDLVGVWEGEALGVEVLDLRVTLYFWIDEDDIHGMIGCKFFVVPIQNISLENDDVQFGFDTTIGTGSVFASIADGGELTCNYKIGEMLGGTGTFTRLLNDTNEGPRQGSLVGVYTGKGIGPLLTEPVDLSLELKLENADLSGKVRLPFGEFGITEVRVIGDRILIKCGNEGSEGLILGAVVENGLEVFWSIGPITGEARLTKEE